MAIRKGNLGSSESFDEVRSLPEEANNTVVHILDQIIQPKQDGGKIHKIIAQLADGSTGVYYCPGFYGQSASAYVMSLFKQYPGDTFQVFARKHEVWRGGRQFFQWTFEDVTEDSDPEWLSGDNDSSEDSAGFQDGYDNNADTLPGSVGGALSESTIPVSPNPAARAKAKARETSF